MRLTRYLILLVVLSQSLGAATYYVAPTGNDSNPGSSGSPWLTVGKATAAAVAGDTVIVKAGTYKEQVFSSANGSAGNPITFIGERDGSGNWLTVIDPNTVYTSGWAAATEIGSGVFKLTNSFTCEELNIVNQRVFFAKTTGDISADVASAYSTGPTTGAGFLTLASAATITTTFNSSQVVTWWDGIEAFWIPSGHTTYLRLRDGSNPNGLSVSMGNTTALKITNSFNVWSNFLIRGANCINLNTINAHHNVISSNYLATGSYRMVVQTGAHDNVIQNNDMTTDYYGYGNPGAWQFGTDSVSGIRLNQYLVCKYMMGDASSLDDCVFLSAAGATNSIVGNHLFKCLGVGIEVNSFVASTPIITNTIIAGNLIENCSSIGVLLSEGNTYTRVYSNSISDCDVNIRFHHMGVGGETNRVLYVYRNQCWEPTLVGQHIFFHFTNGGGSAYNAQCWLYQNSFSGGMGTLADNGFAIAKNGLTNCTFVNNIMSAAYYYFSDDSTWVNPGWVGLFDYNEVTPPVRNYPTNNATPGWFGTHNIKSTTNQWATTQGTSFQLPSGSQAIDTGLDIPTTLSSLPQGADFKVSTAWDMGALENGSFYVTTNGNDSLDGRSPATAWKNLTKPVSSAGSNTIYVGRGIYTTSPWHLSTVGQTYIASNSVFVANPRFEATDVTLTNFNVGYGFFGGFDSDPVCWFRPGSDRSQLLGGSITSAFKKNQYGIIFGGNYGYAGGVEITNFGVSGICFSTGGNSNTIEHAFIHDNPSMEAITYMWGRYNNMLSCVVSNNNDVGLPGSHPDLFQSFFATSLGQVISNNLFINNDCQFGSLQPVDGPDGGTYASNAGEWLFANNVFINQGSKMDVDFYGMRFVNNTFYNCNNDTAEGQVFGFNWSIYGFGTNGIVINNLFAICGSSPTSADQGWFGISEGTNTSNRIRNSLTVSNNYVVGSAYGTKTTNLLIGTNWINGGNPKFLSAESSRLHVLNLRGTTGANLDTNIFGTNASFTTQLAVGDRITLGPYWTNTIGKVVRIVNATNLWVDVPIGTGTSTKFGGPQGMQRVQGFDPVPDLRLLFGSPAIDAGATLDYNPYDALGVARPVAAAYDIGAYEGATQPEVPTNLVMWLSFNGWEGTTNVLDVTTNHNNGEVYLTTPWRPTVGFGPDGSDGAHMEPNGFFGVTNLQGMRNLTNGTVAVWASRTNGVGNLYSYLLDCGFTFPATNGFTLGADNGNETKLFVCSPGSARITVLTYPDFHSTNYNHYGFSWSNGLCVGYFNGLPFQTNALPAPTLTMDNADWLAIGVIQHDEQPGSAAFTNAATAFVRGDITDVRYYNTALSDAELLQIYNVHALPAPPVLPPPAGGSLPPQLLAHYTFVGWFGRSNVVDQTTNHSDAIAINLNGPTLVAGPFVTNVAGHFADNQWLAVTNTPTFEYLTNGTLATWINYDNAVGSGDHFAVDGFYAFPDTNCFWLAAPNSGTTQFRSIKNSGSNTNLVFNDWAFLHAWHHYGVTWDGTNIVGYLDGTPFRTNAQTVTFFHIESTAKWLAFGVQHASHTQSSPVGGWLDGSMADIRIYNYALAATNMFRLAQFADPIGGVPVEPPVPPSTDRIARVTDFRVNKAYITP